jgi:hypothetical protein
LLVPSVNLTVRHGLSSGRIVACCRVSSTEEEAGP